MAGDDHCYKNAFGDDEQLNNRNQLVFSVTCSFVNVHKTLVSFMECAICLMYVRCIRWLVENTEEMAARRSPEYFYVNYRLFSL